MKNHFMVFSTLAFASVLSAQPIDSRNSPSALFDNFREMDEVKSVSIPPFLLNWGLGMARIFSKDPQIDIGGVRSLVPLGLIQSAETIRVAHTGDAEAAKKMQEMFGEFIDKSGFSEFVRSNEKRKKDVIYVQLEKNRAHLLIYAEKKQRDFSVVYLEAKIDAASFMAVMAEES